MTKRERFIIYPVFFVIAVLFLLAFSLWESPLYPHWYGCDASFFSMAGRGITKGWVPYLDFFDLKGPYFFFLQALGQFLHNDRTGVFILEIPFFTASLILMYELARLFVSRLKAVSILLMVLFMHVATLWGGNTLEEYMLPLNLLVLFLTLKYALLPADHTEEAVPENKSVSGTGIRLDLSVLPPFVPVITGVCFGIIAFSKITVAAPIGGVVIAVFLNDLLEKKYRSLLKYLAFSLLGVLIAVCPVFLYFGYHHAIPRMLYSVFSFAFKRSVDFSEPFNLEWERKLLGATFAFLLAIFHPKRIERPVRILLLSVSAITYILLHLGVPFIYYFTTVFPVFVFAFALFLRLYDPLVLFANIRQFLLLALIVILFYYYAHPAIDTIKTFADGRDNTWYSEDYQAARELATLIPEKERDQVFSFSTDMIWFEANQILPCNPYQVNLQFFIDLDPEIGDELRDYLTQTPPKWLVVGDNFEGEIPFLYEIVDREYDCICSNNSGNLYLLKE
ncbi:MAG: hypothetical protein K6D90_09705 [Lachnospiraceae bacterium]|nr:hypothetical protein [Lachnospiraceae bacterium]